MTILESFNFVEYVPLTNNNPIMIRRRKLLVKIEEQLALAKDSSYVPIHIKWVTDEDGSQRKVQVPKRIKKWWTLIVDGKVNLVVRYGSKVLELTKGKNAIELASEAEVVTALAKIKEAVELGEFDTLIENQLSVCKRMTQKNK